MTRIGFDLSKEAVRMAARGAREAAFFAADLKRIPLADGCADAVLDELRQAHPDCFAAKRPPDYMARRRRVEAILRDEQSILTVSSLLTGQYGLYDVCLSLPCIVGVNGVAQTLPIHLSDEEMTQLHASADAIRSAIQLMND